MSVHCHHHDEPGPAQAVRPGYDRVLWAALGINLVMFLVEIASGLISGSVALLADAIDFFSDAANYGITLAVLPLGLAWRSRAAQFKGVTMLLLGLFVAGRAVWALAEGQPPEALTMGLVGLLALAANVGVAAMLYAYRQGDANMRSAWICSRNDAIGNLAVVAAALGVFGTGTAWPDLLVAGVMVALAVSGGWRVIRLARREQVPLGQAG
jgi:Co/Zn/Cd efflux system component